MNRILIFTVFATFAILHSCSGDSNEDVDLSNLYVHIPPELPDSVYSQLKPGDIIIRKGNGPLSYHLMRNTKEDYSHCGVIVEEEGVWRVIHTIGGTSSEEDIDGMQMMDLDEFVAHGADSMVYICRPIFDDSLDIKVPERAYHYLDQKIPFDHGFSIWTKNKFYCSELLFYIFWDIHGKNIFEVEKKNRSYMLMFSTFFDQEKFSPIFHLKDDNRK